jgi:hypothetical protein
MWPAKILVGCDDAGIRGRLSHHKIVSGQSEVRLLVNIEHQFREAHASIWLDHQLVYERTLQGTAKSHVVLFRKTVSSVRCTIVPAFKLSWALNIGLPRKPNTMPTAKVTTTKNWVRFMEAPFKTRA